MTSRSLLVAVLLACTGVWPGAGQAPAGQEPQAPPVTFRAEIDYVEVDATVTDAGGRLIRDLRPEDFEVLEDGRRQRVVDFALVDLPAARGEQPSFATAPIEPDVESNEHGIEGRLFVLLLDDLHTTALRSPHVRAAARELVERHLGAHDLTAVVYTSGRSEAAQDFTRSRRRLLAAVDRFQGLKAPSPVREQIDEYYRHLSRDAIRPPMGAREGIGDLYDFQRAASVRDALGTLRRVSDWLSGVRGRRKAVILFSEGIDYDIYDPFSSRQASVVLEDVREAIGAATRANVIVYAVDPRGLTGAGEQLIELQSFPDDPTRDLGLPALQQELRLSQDSLRILSEQTGGFAVVDTGDLAGGLARIVSDNSAYYLLGYYSSNTRRDGRLRRIEVRVRRPGVTVRARQGYVAPRGRAPRAPGVELGAADVSAALREIVSSPLPTMAGVRLRGFTAAFRGGAEASVLLALQVDGRDLRFTERDGQFRNALEVALVARDGQGRTRFSTRQTFDLGLRPETHEAVRERGFRMFFRLGLPPGRYQLRAAVRESGGGAGSIHTDVEVDDFAGTPLAASGLVLTSTQAGLMPTARLDEELRDVLPGPPTATREFGPDEALVLFVEIYDNQGAARRVIDIATSVLDDQGRVRFQAREARSSEELQGARGAYGHVVQLPLDSLTSGLYVLRVEASSRAEGDARALREVLFRVRPSD